MKKVLLGTSALFAVGMFASSGAMADYKIDPDQHMAASGGPITNSPISIQVGGTFNILFAVGNQHENAGLEADQGTLNTAANTALGGVTGGGTTAAANSLRNTQLFREGEIRFRGETRLDNGLLVGVRVNYETADSVDLTDEAWMFMDSAYGRVEMGETDGAPWKMIYSAPNAIPNFGTNSFNLQPWNTNINTSRVVGSSVFLSLANDADKINYFTPRIFGFQIGVTYSAENCREGNTGLGGNYCNSQAIGFENNANPGQYGNTIEFGTNYVNKFGDVDFAVYGGIQHAQKEANGTGTLGGGFANTTATGNGSTSLDRDPLQWGLGGQVGFAGFQFGGAYKYDNGNATNAAGWQATMGLKYNFAPFSVGIEGSHNQYEEGMNVVAGSKTTARTGWDKSNKIFLGGTYLLGPGITTFAGVAHVTLKNGDPQTQTIAAGAGVGNSVNNTANILLVGTQLTF